MAGLVIIRFFGTNYSSLYNASFQEYPNTVYIITRSDADNSLEREAFVAYESGNYEVAIDKFNEIAENDKKEYFNFYKAQAYLSIENTEEAKTLFKAIIANNETFKAESHWYLALIAIKNKNKEEAITYLNSLVTNDNFNKDKALALLDELK